MRDFRVLHIAETVRGGVATYLNHLWPHQAQLYGPLNVFVLAPDDETMDLPSVPRCNVRLLPRRSRSIRGILPLIRVIRQVIREIEPDLIHLHSSFAGFYGRLLRAVGQAPASIVYCSHGWSFERESSFATRMTYRGLERWLAGCCDAVVCISKSEYRAGRRAGLPREKCFLVHNALPPAPRSRAGGPVRDRGVGLSLLFIGRLDRQKGLDVLLEAMRELEGSSIRLTVLGAAVLDDLGRPLEVPRNVEMLGWRDPVERDRFISRCDAVVVPSRWEGFGFVALEAMRLGKAVVASRVGGLREIVEDGVTGRLVAPGDPAALAEALRSLRREQLSEWGRAGLGRFESSFGYKAMTDRLAEIYAGCQARSAGAGSAGLPARATERVGR